MMKRIQADDEKTHGIFIGSFRVEISKDFFLKVKLAVIEISLRKKSVDFRYHPSLDSKKHQQLKFWHLKTLNFFQGAAMLNDVAALLNDVPLPPGVAHMPPPAVPASPTLAQRNVGYQVSRLATGKQEAGGFWSKGP